MSQHPSRTVASSTLVRFGPDHGLFGILSGAGQTQPGSAGTPVLILPNAGLVPRAGPSRLHVELAQRLARKGIRTFRFDTPGVGEAPRLARFSANDSISAAMDALQRDHGCDGFVVGGVCSAADLGWHAAVDDPRVVGMLILDGISFAGPWFHAARLWGVARRGPAVWWGMSRRWNERRIAAAARARPEPTIAEYRDWPDKATAQRQFAQLVGRGVRSLWVYTGGFRDLFLHRRQFTSGFGPGARDPKTSMHHWPDVDHTFYAREHRDRLLGLIEEWMLKWKSAPDTL